MSRNVRISSVLLLLNLAACGTTLVPPQESPTGAPALTVDDGPQSIDGYTVTPDVASPLVAGVDLVLISSITRPSEPDPTRLVIDRGASRASIYNGATLEPVRSAPVDRGGHGGMLALETNQVAFGTTLPSPGRYVVITELTVDGRSITVRNVYDAIALPEGTSTDEEGAGGHSMDDGAKMMGEMRTVRVEAYQWGFEPATIRVTRGTHLRLLLTSRDVPHSFTLREYDLSQTILPGETSTLEFVADQIGSFVYGCDVACGSGHEEMQRGGGTLIVEEGS